MRLKRTTHSLPLHRSLATRIIFGVVVLLVVMSTASILTLRRMSEMQYQFQTAADVYLGLYGDSQEMQRLHVQQKMTLFDYLSKGRDPVLLATYEELGAELGEVLDSAWRRLEQGRESVEPGAQADTLKALASSFSCIRTGCTLWVHKGATTLINPRISDQELATAQIEYSRELEVLMRLLDSYQQRAYNLAESGLAAGVAQHAQAHRLSRILWLIALITGGVFLVAVVASLAPLRELVGVIERIGRGDYAQRLPVRSRDELGVLATAVNEMAAAIRDRQSSLEDQARTIDRARRRFEGVFQGITDLLSIQDTGLVIGEANRALAQTVGLPGSAVIGRRCHEVLFNRDVACEGCPALMTLSSGRAGWMEQEDEETGEIYEHHTYPILDPDGRTVGVVEYTKLVTERRRLERQLEASARLASLGQMTTSIAHEIRNPLSSIKMSLQILGQRLRLGRNDARRLEIARREIDNLEKLLKEMLDLSSASPVERVPTPLLELASQTAAVLDDMAKERGVEVRVHGGPHPAVSVDRDRMGRVLMNLYLNAFEAMRSSAERLLDVEVGGGPRGEAWVRVHDTGDGIDEDTQRQIFSPFFTTRPEGTGLGLAIAWKIVEAHEGRLQVESERGKGTTVSVVLPGEEVA